MKAFTSPVLISAFLWIHATEGATACVANNCARAVTGTRRGSSFPSIAKADCTSFMVATQFAHTVTITVDAPVPTSTAKSVPTYASACSGSVGYASACSCWGVTSTTVSNTTGTTTVTVSAVPTQTGPGYEPAIPASYASCVFDPASGTPFELIDPNVLPIVNKGGKAVEATPDEDAAPLTFSHPSAAPANLFDIVLENGNTNLYLAIFKSGAVGFVPQSSNGQSYIGAEDQYVTTVWSVECDGLATAGIVGGARFQFTVKDNGDITASTTFGTKKARDIPVPKGFYVAPKNPPVTPPGSKCPSTTQHAEVKTPPITPVANGCGPEGFWGYFVPNLDFVDACNFHDLCWADCSATMASCNTGFHDRMVAKCNSLYEDGSMKHGACIRAANFYLDKVSGDYAAGHYTETVQQFCDCKCNDASLTACGENCVDTKTDAKNCGSCNFNCPTGSCTNGACSFNSCAGQTCSTFGPCGSGGSCVCASVSGGLGFCVDGNTPCDGLAGCGTSTDCPLGSVCAANTCCGRNVCITTDSCGGFGGNTPRDIFKERGWTNATLGHLPEYIS